MNSKPLYRKENKRTHNGWGWYYFFSEKYRHHRNGKNVNLSDKVSIKRHSVYDRVGYDYTPLIRFLHSHVGQSWPEVFHECQSRLNDLQPLLKMVVNVNERGLVVNNHPDGNLPKVCSTSEDSYWSTLFVDEDGLLQFVDKDYVQPPLSIRPEFTDTWNGKPNYHPDDTSIEIGER